MKGLAGTRRAADVCAGCRHARLRHAQGGRGGCSGTNWIPAPIVMGRLSYVPDPCTCRSFTDREDG